MKEAFKGTKYKVFVKPHPYGSTKAFTSAKLTTNYHTGSLHQLIANSSAVYTVNSGSGFEALLHNKRVFTAGHCDYHWVTDTIKTEEDLKNSIELIDQPIDEDSITKFLHYCFNHHFVNINDEKSIERRLLRAIEDATNN